MGHTHADGTPVDWSKIILGAFTPDVFHVMVNGRPEPLPLDYDGNNAHLPHTKDDAAADYQAWEASGMLQVCGANYDLETVMLAVARPIRTVATKEAKKDENLVGAALRQKIEENFAIGMMEVMAELEKWKKRLPDALRECNADIDEDVPISRFFQAETSYLNVAARRAIRRADGKYEPLPQDDNEQVSLLCREEQHEEEVAARETLKKTKVTDPLHKLILELHKKGISHEKIGEIVSEDGQFADREVKRQFVDKVVNRYMSEVEQEYGLPHKKVGRAKRLNVD